jgi:hypothetical protein
VSEFGSLTRHELRSASHALQWSPERLRRKVLGRGAHQFIENFDLGLRANHILKDGSDSGIPDLGIRGWWSDLYARIAGMSGPASVLVLQLNASLGVKDETELRELVEDGRKFRDSSRDATLSPRQYGDMALDMVEKVMRLDADFAALVRERIGTNGRAQDAPSTNGHSNGD